MLPLIADPADVERHACLTEALCKVRLDARSLPYDRLDRVQFDDALVPQKRSTVTVALVRDE